MRLLRSSRFAAALVALFSMLFMQLAVASYVCPGESIGGHSFAGAMADMPVDHAMTDCEDMDPVQPHLCHAYDQSDNQSLDKPQLPVVQPFIATGMAVPIGAVTPVYVPDTPLADGVRLAHAIAPPIAIRNCCLRI